MRRPLKHPRVPLDVLLGTLLGGAAVGAAAVIGVGLFDVSARDGHWPGVPWVLHTTYERSVALRAPPASSVPELDDDALVALGAAHFELACSQCHGAPGRERTATVRAMLPAPPHVGEAVDGWEPAQLFWILKNGVKMSGMPHWPSTVRDDGVWAVVAFLERIEGMDAAGYAALLGTGDAAARRAHDARSGAVRAGEGGASEAGGATEGGDATAASGTRGATTASGPSGATDGGRASDADPLLASCALCHGLDGSGRGNTHVPRLDLLDEAYLTASLAAYRDGRRHSGIMQHAASTLADADIARLARRYARRPAEAPPSGTGDAPAGHAATVLTERGRELATGASASVAERRDVPVCAACHGPWPGPLSARYPSIAAQHQGFLLAQLRAWRAGTRGGTALARMMHAVVPALDDGDVRALAAYYASLPPEPAASPGGGTTKAP